LLSKSNDTLKKCKNILKLMKICRENHITRGLSKGFTKKAKTMSDDFEVGGEN